jgi:iron complex transport system substrate-binding protein
VDTEDGVERINRLTGQIIGAALQIHSALGPGLFESVYEVVLAKRLAQLGLRVERQKPVSFEFDGIQFDEGFRADLVVEATVVVEVKSVRELAAVHLRQLLTYLRLLGCPAGLVINFDALHLRDGIKRVANGPLAHPPRNPPCPP